MALDVIDINHFLILGIKDFHSSIYEKLLYEAIRSGKRHTFTSKKSTEVIFYTRKSLLFINEQLWMKKGDRNSDVIMVAYYISEVCELIGIFI